MLPRHRKKKFNLMSTQSLAVVLVPNIFRQRQTGKQSQDLAQVQSDMSAAVAITMLLIESTRTADTPLSPTITDLDPISCSSSMIIGNANAKTEDKHQTVMVAETGMVVADLDWTDVPDIDQRYLANHRNATSPNDDDKSPLSQGDGRNTQGEEEMYYQTRRSSQIAGGPRRSILTTDQFDYKGPSLESFQRRPTVVMPITDGIDEPRTTYGDRTKEELASELNLVKAGLEMAGTQAQLKKSGQNYPQIVKQDGHLVDLTNNLEIYAPVSLPTSNPDSHNHYRGGDRGDNHDTNSTNDASSSSSHPTSPPRGRQRPMVPLDDVVPPPPTNNQKNIGVNVRSALDTVPEFQKQKLQAVPLPQVPVPVESRPLPPRPDQVQNFQLVQIEQHRRSSVIDRDRHEFPHDHSVPPSQQQRNSSMPRQVPGRSDSQTPVIGGNGGGAPVPMSPSLESSSLSNNNNSHQSPVPQVQAFYALPRRTSIARAGSVEPGHAIVNPRRSISQAPPGLKFDPMSGQIQLIPAGGALPHKEHDDIKSLSGLASVPDYDEPISIVAPVSMFGSNSAGIPLGRKIATKKNYYVPGRGQVSMPHNNAPGGIGGGIMANYQVGTVQPQAVQPQQPLGLQLPPTPRNKQHPTPSPQNQAGRGIQSIRTRTGRGMVNTNPTLANAPTSIIQPLTPQGQVTNHPFQQSSSPTNSQHSNSTLDDKAPINNNRQQQSYQTPSGLSPAQTLHMTHKQNLHELMTPTMTTPPTPQLNQTPGGNHKPLKFFPPIQVGHDDTASNHATTDPTVASLPQSTSNLRPDDGIDGDADPSELLDQPTQLNQTFSGSDITQAPMFRPVTIRNSISYDSNNRVLSANVLDDGNATSTLGEINRSTTFANIVDIPEDAFADDTSSPLNRTASSLRTFSNDRTAEIISQSMGVSVDVIRERGMSFMPPQDPDELALGWQEFADVDGSLFYLHTTTNTISYLRPSWKNRDKVKLNPTGNASMRD